MSGTLPSWLERWLGLSSGPGMGTAWRLESYWPWPPWVTLLGGLAAVAAIVLIYLKEGRQASRRYRLALAAMRLALVALAATMIAQLAVSLQRTGLPYLVVIVDDSRSMAVVDDYPETLRSALRQRMAQAGPNGSELSRWNLATALLAEHDGQWLAELAESHKLRVYFLTGLQASRRTDVPGVVQEIRAAHPAGDNSRLGAAVRGVLDELRGAVPAAVVLVTDGINTDDPSLMSAAAHARRKGVPLFFVGLGSDRPVRNLKLSDPQVDDVVFVNNLVNFRFKLTGWGLAGKRVAVVLRQEGPQKDKPQTLARAVATVGPDGQPQEVRIPYRPTQVGELRYTIDIEPPDEGLQTKNPPLAGTIQVRKEKIRVLLVQAYPSFEYRFLRNMLARDETIDLHTVLQEADPEYAEQEKKNLRVFPVRRDELFAYDVVILGDANPALLSPAAMQALADFVDQPGKGGALVLVAGPRYMPQAFRGTPLARLMPFDPATVRYPEPNRPLTEGFVARPTDLGMSSPAMQLGDSPEQSRAIWQNLPPLYWMAEVGDLTAGAVVLVEHPTRQGPDGRRLPLVIMQYVGAGKVLFQATDETYRWRHRVGDVFFARYWLQTIRWLSRSKLADGNRSARLVTDRREYRAGDPVRVEVRFTDERLAPVEDNGVAVVLQRAGQADQRVELHRVETGRGVFESVVERLPEGAYHARLAVPMLEGKAPAADFNIAPPEREMARIQMEASEMRQAAEMTKGRFYMLSDADRLPGDVPEGRQVPMENLPAIPLWNRWPVLLLFLVVLIGEWLLRKRGGMV